MESYISFELPPEVEKEAKEHGVIGTGTWDSVIYGCVKYYILITYYSGSETVAASNGSNLQPCRSQKTIDDIEANPVEYSGTSLRTADEDRSKLA